MGSQKLTKSEIDIEIKDLLWELARRWRIIVVTALICAVGLTAYQYRSDMNKTDVVVVKKTQEELEKAMSVQDVSEVTGAVALLNQLGQKSQYMDTSVLMQINPYAENAVLLQYVVEADALTEETITNAYLSYVEDGYLAQVLAADEDVETVYVDELISVVKDNTDMYVYSDTMDESIQMTIAGTETGSCITVKVCGMDEAASAELATEVKSALTQYTVTLNKELGAHQLKLVEETACVLVDNALAELQNRNATAIKTISNNIDKMKNEMTGDQITLYTYRVTGVTQSASTTTTAAPKAVTISVKHAVIGFVVGAVLGCGIALALYLLSARLRNSEEIKTLYQVKVLGTVDNPQKKNRMFSFVDKLIEKAQNYNKKTLSYDQAVQMVCANIAIDCKQNEQKKVYLTGSMMEQMPEQIINDITKQCAEKGIAVVKGNAVAYDAESLEVLEQTGTVVFLEQKRTSFYEEIYKEIVLCKENGIQVMGIVVIGE